LPEHTASRGYSRFGEKAQLTSVSQQQQGNVQPNYRHLMQDSAIVDYRVRDLRTPFLTQY
jgi:Ni/Co efflux regulator RcnB